MGARKRIIVVGGGTAGSIVAKNLSSMYDVKVFDKGANKKMPLIYRVPLLIGLLFNGESKYVKKLKIQFNTDRTVPFFESNLIGGASIINGCVHVIGNTKIWLKILKKFNLKLENFYESYRKIYTRVEEKEKINISTPKESDLDTRFFEALKIFNVLRGDVEWADSAGCGMIFNTVKRYFRSSVLDLRPFAKSKLIDNCKVERLVVNSDSKIIGVFDGKSIHLGDYIILCAGVIETNSILLRRAISIDDYSLVDLQIDAGVGLKDHTNLRINVRTNQKIHSLNEINSSFYQKSKLAIYHALGASTLMRGTGATATANLDIDKDGEVDTRINLLKFCESGRMGSSGKLFSSPSPGFSISITHLNPRSVGSITVSEECVALKLNYLYDSADLNHLKESLKFVIGLIKSGPLNEILESIENIENIISSPEKYILENTYSGYHLIGGCSHLVDSNFAIFKHNNLFVCDASIFSEYPSSNIHSSVVIMADLFASKFRLIETL